MRYEEAKEILRYPFVADTVMRKQRALKRALLESGLAREIKIAVLGGCTTADIVNILELFLLADGIRPRFYQSEYNKYYEDAVFDNAALRSFQPDMVFICTSNKNLLYTPDITDTEARAREKLAAEYGRYERMWSSLRAEYKCVIIQNNFDLPALRRLGNRDGRDLRGLCCFIGRLNAMINDYAAARGNFHINDIHFLSAQTGLERWADDALYHAYKMAFSYSAVPVLSYSLANIIKSILGKSKKCLVLDLDNTLWGGEIGDLGAGGIELGPDTARGEAYRAFQEYVLSLQRRGVILAVCSKNDEANARAGFAHPHSALKAEDFAVFKANWQPKHLNIAQIARELNIGADSLVFMDDNPAERKIVADNLPEVAVVAAEREAPENSAAMLDKSGYFEPAGISAEDLRRAASYAENARRDDLCKQFASYDDFLRSLDMQAEIKPFSAAYLERVTQLANKTNQFNLTTRRYTTAEMEKIASSGDYITLYGRLADIFGDNGLVAEIIGRVDGERLHIELWLMSCRVLKRGLEDAMFEQLLQTAAARGIKEIAGYYYKTAKNQMVAGLYEALGFVPLTGQNGDSSWLYKINGAMPATHFIKVNGGKF